VLQVNCTNECCSGKLLEHVDADEKQEIKFAWPKVREWVSEQ